MEPLRLCSTRYPLTVPLGAVQLTTSEASAGVITNAVGAAGSARAVTVAGAEEVPIPALVIAETRKDNGIPTRVAV